MKRLLPTIFIVLVTAGAIAWLMLNFRAKRKYDEMRSGLTPPYDVLQMDDNMKEFMTEVESYWTKAQDFVGGTTSEGLEAIGLKPTVSNLARAYEYSMPPYSFTNLNRNREAAVMGVFQSIILTMSFDRAVFLSSGHDLLLNRIGTNQVVIWTDTSDGLRERLYYTKNKGIEQSPEPY